jgi:Trypsin
MHRRQALENVRVQRATSSRACQPTALPLGAATSLLAGVLALAGCGDRGVFSSDDSRDPSTSVAQPLLGADGGPEGSGLAFVAHTQGSTFCSGVLIAPTLVLTAKHCVFLSGASGDAPLPAAGFQVGFGPSRDVLVERSVDLVQWVGMPGALSVTSAVAAGEDVALLRLSEPAPPEEAVRDVSLATAFSEMQPVLAGGYGVTDLATGASGTRGVASGHLNAFDPNTGIIEIAGAPVCFGDSGGPILRADGAVVLGVLGQVASPDGSFCSDALGLADTAANINVQRFLAKACAAVGGCGPVSVGPLADAAIAADADEASAFSATDGGFDATSAIERDAGPSEGVHVGPGPTESRASSCACAAPGAPTRAASILALAWLLVIGRAGRALVRPKPRGRWLWRSRDLEPP